MTGVGEEGEGAGGGRRREQRLGVISAAVFTRRSTAAGVQVQLQVRAGGRAAAILPGMRWFFFAPD